MAETEQVVVDYDSFVERMRAGDERAADQLFTSIHPYIARLALQFYPNDSVAAEEVVDFTVVQMTSGILVPPGYQENGTFPHWVRRIARNHAATLARRSKFTGGSLDGPTLPHAIGRSYAAPSAEDIALGNLGLDINSVLKLLAERTRLDETTAEAFLQYFDGDLTGVQIASILGVPTSTVRSRIHRTRQVLRRVLTEQAQAEKD